MASREGQRLDLSDFRIADEDTVTEAPDEYYGFVDMRGDWYIVRISGTGGQFEYRYAHGDAGTYVASWIIRASLPYDYMFNTFPGRFNG